MDQHTDKEEPLAAACAPGPSRSEHDLLSRYEPCAPDEPAGDTSEERDPPKKLNLVLEGGGLRGVALVGAVAALAEALTQKYKDTYISYLAGTSAGAIVATLLGARYTPAEIASIVGGSEFASIADPVGPSFIPVVGMPIAMAWGAITRLGMLKGDALLSLFREKLDQKGIRTFRDLIMPGCENEKDPARKYRVHLVASDITRGRMLVLPDDISAELYGVEPDDLEVALAVRMSMSFPFVFSPVRLTGRNKVTSYIVDGGLLSNFPVHLFDTGAPAPEETLTLGIRVLRARYHAIHPPFIAARALWALSSTVQEARDVGDTSKLVDRLKWARVIEVNAEAVPIFKFNANPLALTPVERELLYNAGYYVTKRALATDFLERGRAVHAAAARAERGARRTPGAAVVRPRHGAGRTEEPGGR
ncbi:patatin-like phospholipase family protein [Sorangium sp. So ce1000]|uniref:patatin-like phospholipase family protein n=1 Tax=Sorangium sp. So ce1000 TaxID=3133325 RepID=UPI003F5FA376